MSYPKTLCYLLRALFGSILLAGFIGFQWSLEVVMSFGGFVHEVKFLNHYVQ